MPTIMNAVGIPIQKSWNLDGIDITSFISDENAVQPERILFWKEGKDFAARNSEWKIVKMGKKMELYNLLNDPYETTDLSDKNPEQLANLLTAYNKWNSKNIPAQYGYGSEKEFPYEVIRTRRTKLKR